MQRTSSGFDLWEGVENNQITISLSPLFFVEPWLPTKSTGSNHQMANNCSTTYGTIAHVPFMGRGSWDQSPCVPMGLRPSAWWGEMGVCWGVNLFGNSVQHLWPLLWPLWPLLWPLWP